jgi:thiamine pyrophosphokinase
VNATPTPAANAGAATTTRAAEAETEATMPTRTALIVGGGGRIACDRLRRLASNADFIVGADAGIAHLADCRLKADAIIGDLDSATPAQIRQLPPQRIIHDPAQDDTDLEKAIRWCLEREYCQAADIVSVTGGRLDHTLNAVSLILRYQDRLHITLHDRDGYASFAAQSPLSLNCRIGEKLSLIPAPAAYGLHSAGLRYPLNGLDLVTGGRDAISNEATAVNVELTWSEGSFLVYRQIGDHQPEYKT